MDWGPPDAQQKKLVIRAKYKEIEGVLRDLEPYVLDHDRVVYTEALDRIARAKKRLTE